MKRRWTYLLIFALILSLLSGCNNNESPKGAYAIRVGDLTVSESAYSRLIQELRTGYLSTTDKGDTKEFWQSYVDDDTTLSQFITDFACRQLTNEKLYVLQFDKLGLSLSREEEEAMRASLEDEINAAGGMSAFQESLAESGYTYEEYTDLATARLKKEAVIDYYFGAEGKQKKTPDQDIKDWYNLHNAYIHAILFLRTDSTTGELLSEEEQKDALAKAQTAYESAARESEKDYFDEIAGIYQEHQGVQTGDLVVSDSGTADALTEAALALKIGQVQLVETDGYYALIKRYDGTTDELFTPDLRIRTLETIRREPLDQLLEQWGTDFGVERHKATIDRYTPEYFME